MIIMYMFFLTFTLVFFFFFASFFFMENKLNEVSESPFECGFEPISFSRIPFSIQFFSITIIFLIFDLEIVIIIPLMKSYQSQFMSIFFLSLIIFFLIFGLIIEWYDGSLNWIF